LKELDYPTVIKPDAHRQGVSGRDLDILDPLADNCFELEPKIGSAKGIELDERVAELFSCRLADRSHLDDIEAIDSGLISDVNYALSDELPRMSWNRNITYDPPCEQVPTSTPKLARINKGADDQRSIERGVGCSFSLSALRSHPALLQLTNTLIPLLVKLAVMGQDHGKPDSCGDAERPFAVPGVIDLDEVRIYRLPLGRAVAILGDDAR
jgi:hypothetical protein